MLMFSLPLPLPLSLSLSRKVETAESRWKLWLSKKKRASSLVEEVISQNEVIRSSLLVLLGFASSASIFYLYNRERMCLCFGLLARFALLCLLAWTRRSFKRITYLLAKLSLNLNKIYVSILLYTSTLLLFYNNIYSQCTTLSDGVVFFSFLL